MLNTLFFVFPPEFKSQNIHSKIYHPYNLKCFQGKLCWYSLTTTYII